MVETDVNKDQTFKYLGIFNVKLSTYLRCQRLIIIGLALAAVLVFFATRGHDLWFVRYLWCVPVVGALGEIVEYVVVLAKVRASRQKNGPGEP